MSARNRQAGNAFERTIARLLKPLFPKVITSRYGSRELDSQKVDLMHTGIYNFQIKLTANTPTIRLLDEMPAGRNVIVWGKTERRGSYIMQNGTYAIIKFDLLLELLNETQNKNE
jgi:hypothetical protein